MTGIPVLAAPVVDPGRARIEMTLAEGLTLAEIVKKALPGIVDHGCCRVCLVTAHEQAVVLPALWGRIRPKPGVRVVIRIVPDGDSLRSVLLAVVSVAAAVLAGPAGFGLTVGTLSHSLVALGLPNFGGLAVDPLSKSPPTARTSIAGSQIIPRTPG